MRLASSITALGACAVLVVVLAVRYGLVAALAGVGLAVAGGLVAVDLPGRRDSPARTDDGGIR